MSFIVNGQAVDGPAFAMLHDGTARLLFRVSLHCSESRSEFLSPVALHALGGSERQASELVLAGFWAPVPGGWIGLFETPRQRAGRRNGLLSAQLRAERVTAITRSSNEGYSPQVSPVTPSSNEPYSPQVTAITRSSNGDYSEPNAGGPCFPPLGSPSLDHSSYSDLFRIPSSPLLASLDLDPKELTGSARVQAPGKPAKPKQATWRRVPETWQPTPEHTKIAIAMAVDLQLEASKFRDHEFARPKRDADATFRNWLRAAKPSPRPINGAGHNATPRKYATVEDVSAMLGLK
jgi:hypothetical protein